MAVQITRRRMRSGGGTSPAFSALALTGGFAGAAAAPVGLAAELGESAVFVSAWSAIGNYVNLVLGKQYKCNQTFVYKAREALCQADLRKSRRSSAGLQLSQRAREGHLASELAQACGRPRRRQQL